MSSYEELFTQDNPDLTLAINNITNAFVTLPSRVSQVKHSINQCSSSNSTTDSNSGSSNFNNNDNDNIISLPLNTDYSCNKLKEDLNQIKGALYQLEKLVNKPIKTFHHSLNDIFNILAQDPSSSSSSMIEQVQAKLSALENHMDFLRERIPMLPHNMSSTSPDVHRYLWKNQPSSGVDKLPGLHPGHKSLYSSVFAEFKENFEDLDIKLKRCLLCFAIVPENVVVKKRLLINWWVGERLVDPPDTGEKTDEEIADEILKELVSKGFIEAVKERRKLVADRYKMRSRMRYLVIILATETGLFDYDFNGNPTANSSRCNRAYLLKAEHGSPQSTKSPDLELEKLQTIFNVNDPFHFLKFEWFSKMKNVNVLYLGRWQSSGEHHIEVESVDFLRGLMNMKYLRLLSLQGISRINELPKSVCKLTNLRILDLKACHNLEELPDGVDLLKQLTRLDISECYLLDGIPKGLAHLSKLEVLKGFLIGNLKSGGRSCTLEDLIGLERLSNLSINTSSRDFPTEEELHALSKLEALRKLGIAWGMKQENAVPKPAGTANSDNRGQDTGASRPTRRLSKRILSLPKMRDPETLELPTKLEKLKLQCLPHRLSPNWLIPRKLKSLKKLYIRGGELESLVQTQKGNDEWTVKILHLKYLDKFNMDWEALHKSFPNLIFLEKFECGNLTSYPCDSYGVWQKP